jgi:hypothetical protein
VLGILLGLFAYIIITAFSAGGLSYVMPVPYLVGGLKKVSCIQWSFENLTNE